MKRTAERIKDGKSCGVDIRDVSLAKAIDEAVEAELKWGGIPTFDSNSIKFTTRVMGCIDYTEFQGTDYEVDLLRKICEGFKQDRVLGVQNTLLTAMSLPLIDAAYRHDDLISALDLYLTNTSTDDISTLLTPVVSRQHHKLSGPVSTDWLNVANELGPDDGISMLIRGLNAEYKLNELMTKAN